MKTNNLCLLGFLCTLYIIFIVIAKTDNETETNFTSAC